MVSKMNPYNCHMRSLDWQHRKLTYGFQQHTIKTHPVLLLNKRKTRKSGDSCCEFQIDWRLPQLFKSLTYNPTTLIKQRESLGNASLGRMGRLPHEEVQQYKLGHCLCTVHITYAGLETAIPNQHQLPDLQLRYLAFPPYVDWWGIRR